MSTHVRGADIGSAWLAAFCALVETGGDGLVNLAVTIDDPLSEDRAIRAELERTIIGLHNEGLPDYRQPQSVHTVANTIFPISLYRRSREDSAAAFFRSVLMGQRGRGGSPTTWHRSGTYIGRLLRYPKADGKSTVNQLEAVLERLQKIGPDGRKRPNAKDRYELSPEAIGDFLDVEPEDGLFAMTYVPGFDNQARGGQCLSHISLTLLDERLSMTAIYRHQVYITKAYGNFLGLARLLAFLAHESDRQVGELMVVATHADIDAPTSAAGELLDAATECAGNDVVPIEVESRRFGTSWRDLELPTLARG